MKKLTKAEEEVMQIVWDLERCLVSDLLDHLEKEKGMERPPHSTISSIVRSLEAKEFVGHKAYGRTYEYFPLVSREEYSRTRLRKLATDYFDGSMKNLVSFLVKDKELSIRELSEMLELLQKGDQQKGK